MADGERLHYDRNQTGFTLVEILVVLAVTGIVTVGLVSFMISQSRGYNLQEDLAEMEQNARVAMEYFTNQLRKAKDVTVFTTDDNTGDDLFPLIEIDGEKYYFRKSSTGGDLTNEMQSERIGIQNAAGSVNEYVAYFLQDVNGDGNLDLPMFQRNGDTLTITIVGRTRHVDPRYNTNGGYRQIVLTSRVVLRNS